MSSTNFTPGSERRSDDRTSTGDALSREAQSARSEASGAASELKDGASRLLSDAKSKAYEGVEKGKSAAVGSLEDFTAAIRKASDELGDRDQSMAAGLVRQAASGLEQASDALKGQNLSEITNSVAQFARRQPAAFLIGAALAGVALGRFARASSDHADGERLRHATGQDRGSHGSSGSAYGYGSDGRSGLRDRDEFRSPGSGTPSYAPDNPAGRSAAGTGASSYGASSSTTTGTPSSGTAGSTSSGSTYGGASTGSGSGSGLGGSGLGASTPRPVETGTGLGGSLHSSPRPSASELGSPGASGSTNTSGLSDKPLYPGSSSVEGDKR